MLRVKPCVASQGARECSPQGHRSPEFFFARKCMRWNRTAFTCFTIIITNIWRRLLPELLLASQVQLAAALAGHALITRPALKDLLFVLIFEDTDRPDHAVRPAGFRGRSSGNFQSHAWILAWSAMRQKRTRTGHTSRLQRPPIPRALDNVGSWIHCRYTSARRKLDGSAPSGGPKPQPLGWLGGSSKYLTSSWLKRTCAK